MRPFLLAAALALSPAARAADPPKLETHSYAVADLITPPADASKLLRTLTDMVRPSSWEGRGGPGKIEYSSRDHTLTVTNTPDVLEHVDRLIAALPKLHEKNVVTEVRVISVAPGFIERVGVKCCEGAVLAPREMARLLDAVQGDRRANVMQSPKVTTFDGQAANIRVGEQSFERVGVESVVVDGKPMMVQKTTTTIAGDSMHLCGRVGADGKSVLLRARIARTLPCDETPRVAEYTAAVPCNGTLVVGGWKETATTRTSFGPPAISKIPYLNRLFKNVGTEEREVVVLATPRVVVPEPVPVVPASAEAAKPEVELRMTFLRVPEDFMGKLGMSPDSPNGARMWTVTPREREMFSARLREAQSKGDIDILSTPHVRALSGQTGTVKVGGTANYVTGLDVTVKDGEAVVVPRMTEVPHGLSAEVTPTVSADGKFVRVNLSASYSIITREAKRVPVTVPVVPIFEGGSRGVPVPVQQFVEEVPPQDTQSIGANFVVPAKGTVILGGLLVKPDSPKGERAPKPVELLIVVTPQVTVPKPAVVPASAAPVMPAGAKLSGLNSRY